MRTLEEINRDIKETKDKELLKKLKNEKEEVWNTLFEGHKNYKI